MISWLVENTDLLLFSQGILASVGIYRLASGRRNGREPQSEEKAPLNAEDVFEQLRGTAPFQCGDASRPYLGIRVKATGSLGRVKKLTNDLVVLSIILHGVAGLVSAEVSFSEYHEIRSAKSEQDVTLEGEISSYMDLNDTHQLFLSDAKLYV
jgi:hypothetical protein